MSETFTSRRARRTRAAPSAVSVRHTAPPLRCNRSAPPPCTPPCPATPRRTCLARPAACGSRPPGNRRACGVRPLSGGYARRTKTYGAEGNSFRAAAVLVFSALCLFWFFRRYAVLVFSALCLFCFFGVMPVCEAPCAAPPCASAARRSCRRAYRPPPPAAGRGRARC